MALYWLMRRGIGPEGPYPKTHLCQMVSSGQIHPDDEVSATQSGPWARVSAVPQLAALLATAVHPGAVDVRSVPQPPPPQAGGGYMPPQPPPPQAGGGYAPPPQSPHLSPTEASGPAYLFPARVVESLVAKLDGIAKGGLLDRLSVSAVPLGHIGLLAGGVFLTMFAIVFAMRLDSLKLALAAAGIPIGCAVLQYGSWKFLDACGQVVRNTPTRTSSLVLYQFVAIVLVVVAAATLAAGAYFMIEDGTSFGRYGFATSVVLALYLLIIGLLLLTPTSLNLSVDGTCSAGTDGVSVIGTAMKALLAGSRLVFGVLCVCGAIASGIGAAWFLFDSLDPRPYVWATAGANLIVVGGANAVAVYLVAILYFIIPDLVISVLRHTRETPT